jgi:DNA primase
MEQLSATLRPGDRARLALTAEPHAVSEMIQQALVLHQRARTLHTELKSAERAFSDDPSDANQAWLLDVKARLTSLEGTEASLDQ